MSDASPPNNGDDVVDHCIDGSPHEY